MPLTYLTAGESHGPALIAILEGFPAGLSLDIEKINHELARRQRGYGSGPRMKIERDQAEILSGVMDGITIGSPIALRIKNLNHDQWRGVEVDPFTTPRPGHADLTAALKYGYRDLRPSLERASARETAARVAVGAICKQFLAEFGIQIGGYVTEIGGITADFSGIPADFSGIPADLSEIPLGERFERAEANDVRCPHAKTAEAMRDRIRDAIEARDTLGGVIEVAALNLPIGLGSHVHWERKLEARLGAAVLSVQAIKGVEFGPAFENTRLPGTQVHDAIRLGKTPPLDKKIRENLPSQGHALGHPRHPRSIPPASPNPTPTSNIQYPIPNTQYPTSLTRPTNRAGGIEGGISNGQPLIIRAAMKPIAATLTPQETVDLATGEETSTQYERSDICPVPRAVPIIEAVVAFVLADALLEKLGGDSIEEMRPRFETLPQARLSDLTMDNTPHTWWPE